MNEITTNAATLLILLRVYGIRILWYANAKNPIPKINDIPIREAHSTVMFDIYATVNVHR